MFFTLTKQPLTKHIAMGEQKMEWNETFCPCFRMNFSKRVQLTKTSVEQTSVEQKTIVGKGFVPFLNLINVSS